MMYPELIENPNIMVSTTKGILNHALGEFVMAMVFHFAKNVPLLNRQKDQKKWEKFCISEVKGKTMGIVGYGDIGSSCATLAKACGMKVLALRRNPGLSANDPLIDKVVT